MNIHQAIQCAHEESVGSCVKIFVVESPKEKVEQGSLKFFPCRQDWLEGFGQGYKIVAEAYPNGKICRY